MGLFPGRMKCTKSAVKLEYAIKNRGKFRSTGFENYCWNTIRTFGFGGVELEKGLADFSYGKLDGGHFELRREEVMWLEPLVIQVGI